MPSPLARTAFEQKQPQSYMAFNTCYKDTGLWGKFILFVISNVSLNIGLSGSPVILYCQQNKQSKSKTPRIYTPQDNFPQESMEFVSQTRMPYESSCTKYKQNGVEYIVPQVLERYSELKTS